LEQPACGRTSRLRRLTVHGLESLQWSIAATPEVCQPVTPSMVTSLMATASVSLAHVAACCEAGQ